MSIERKAPGIKFRVIVAQDRKDILIGDYYTKYNAVWVAKEEGKTIGFPVLVFNKKGKMVFSTSEEKVYESHPNRLRQRTTLQP